MPSNSNRGGRSNSGSRNNNPSGRNQYSSGGVMELARERPFTAAATAVGAAAAGLFLWSKRSQISDQISNLSDQLGEWTENMRGGSEDWTSGGTSSSGTSSSGQSQSDISAEAMTLKSTGKKAKRPADPMVEQQTKAGSVAY
jgi:hypothetical protein